MKVKEFNRRLLRGELTFTDCNFSNYDFGQFGTPDFTELGLVFIQCNFESADLRYKAMEGVLFKQCNLTNARLEGTVLEDTVFDDCVLSGSILDPSAVIPKTDLSELEIDESDSLKRVIGYRTYGSYFIGRNVYLPGRFYRAPYFSIDERAACHPGLYFYGGIDQLLTSFGGMLKNELVRILAKPEDILAIGDGVYRCREFFVTNKVEIKAK